MTMIDVVLMLLYQLTQTYRQTKHPPHHWESSEEETQKTGPMELTPVVFALSWLRQGCKFRLVWVQ